MIEKLSAHWQATEHDRPQQYLLTTARLREYEEPRRMCATDPAALGASKHMGVPIEVNETGHENHGRPRGRIALVAPLVLLLAALLPIPFAARAEPRTCLVVGVSDGDTITARCGAASDYEQVKVRINGIDAPEKRQPFGQRSKEALSDLVYMKDAQLECGKVDRYGRSVCKVMVAPASAPRGPKTLDAGLAMVTVGMAWWYRAYSREQTPQERGQYEFAEFEAKAKRAGLWREAAPTPPSDWRAERRSASTNWATARS